MGHLIAFLSLVLGGLSGVPPLTPAPHATVHQDPVSQAEGPARGETSAFGVTVEWLLPARLPYAGETFPMTMEVSVPAGTEHGQLLQLFPQPLGLPLQLSGFEALESSRLMAAFGGEVPAAGASQSVALDGEIAQASGPLLSEGPGGRVSLYTIKRWFKAPRSTTLELPGPAARFAVATEFREDFVQGRVPVDRQTKSVSGASVSLKIRPLPEEGRPFEFAGAIGSFALETIRAPLDLAVGDTLSYTVVISPRGRTAAPELTADAISLAPSDVFREQGRSISTDAEQRTQAVSFSLLALAPSAHANLEASLTCFDPGSEPAGYRVIKAPSPNIQVRGAQSKDPVTTAEALPPAASNDENPDRPTPYWTIGVGAFIFALAVASVIRRHWPRKAANPDHQDPAKNA